MTGHDPRRSRNAALVGTDSASIVAIDPVQLVHLIEDGEWLRAWNDSPGSTKADRILRGYGGAVFLTGADGNFDVKIPDRPGSFPIVSEHGYLPPYGTPTYDEDRGFPRTGTENVTRTYEVTSDAETLDKLERFLAFLHYNGGHSGTFGMWFDGDGPHRVSVDPPPSDEYRRGVSKAASVGGKYELAGDDGRFYVRFDHDDYWYVVDPGQKARKVTHEEVYGSVLPGRRRAGTRTSMLPDGTRVTFDVDG